MFSQCLVCGQHFPGGTERGDLGKPDSKPSMSDSVQPLDTILTPFCCPAYSLPFRAPVGPLNTSLHSMSSCLKLPVQPDPPISSDCE
jgi:hypothetical protein